MKKNINILTIAGFDPTGGAGVLADVKTYEVHKCMGMAVQTANTIQTEDEFTTVNWVEEKTIREQFDILSNKYTFQAIKIGLFPSISFLNTLLKHTRTRFPKAIIVWDPVLTASAGFNFENNIASETELIEVLKQVNWITPNWNEASQLSGIKDAKKGALSMSQHTNVYLKGGHNTEDLGKDFWMIKEEIQAFNPKKGAYYEKHGSGCVFSSALTANLAKGFPKQKAILRAKRYVEYFLASDTSKLGKHYG